MCAPCARTWVPTRENRYQKVELLGQTFCSIPPCRPPEYAYLIMKVSVCPYPLGHPVCMYGKLLNFCQLPLIRHVFTVTHWVFDGYSGLLASVDLTSVGLLLIGVPESKACDHLWFSWGNFLNYSCHERPQPNGLFHVTLWLCSPLVSALQQLSKGPELCRFG